MFRIAVLCGHGINCDRETVHALDRTIRDRQADGAAERVHTSDLVSGRERLSRYDMLVLPGGFLHGDDIAAVKILANTFGTELATELDDFVASDKLVLGICNGFQVLAKIPLLPGRGSQDATLVWNDTGRFEDRWVWLEPDRDSSLYLDGVDRLRLPIRHGEGKFLADDDVLDRLEEDGQVALRYVREDGSPADGAYPYNPNGSLRDIAGIRNDTGRVLGIMPHPEAFHAPANHPQWIEAEHGAGDAPDRGAGMQIFENAVDVLDSDFT
ncbi:MAG: phosphoribosylformylglycinamidine synthase subunit PurQ [Candidatus Nanohaloarchaea archaeon]